MFKAAERKRNTVNLIILLVFAALCLFMVSAHENYRDEIQAWNMAKELSPPELLGQMKYEGHPALWHFILMPFAKAGLPVQVMSLVSAAFVIAAAALFLWRAPLPLLLRLIAVFCSAFWYEYSAISRSYSLIPIIMFLLAAFYADRAERPLRYGLMLAALVQTHVIMLFFAGFASVFFTAEAFCTYRKDKDRKSLFKKGSALCLPLLSLILFIAQVSGAQESSAFGVKSLSLTETLYGLYMIFVIYWAYARAFNHICAVGCLLCIALSYAVFIRGKDCERVKALSIALLGIFGQMYFSLLFYDYHILRYFTWILIWLWLVWVIWPADAKAVRSVLPPVLALLLFLLPAYLGWVRPLEDISREYSGAQSCAAFINENVPSGAVILQCDTAIYVSVVPYLDEGYQVYSTESGETENFKTWLERDPLMQDMDAVKAWVKEKEPDCQEFWLILPQSDSRTPAADNLLLWCYERADEVVLFNNYSRCMTNDEYIVCRIAV